VTDGSEAAAAGSPTAVATSWGCLAQPANPLRPITRALLEDLQQALEAAGPVLDGWRAV
jgi:hypothetical protein